MKRVSSIGVIGAGTMGAGIAQVAAIAGYKVVLVDTTDEFVRRGLDKVAERLKRLVDKGTIPDEESQAAFGRVAGSVETHSLGDADLVIEAVIESIETKLSVFAEIDGVVGETAILASNTSSLSLIHISEPTRR